MNGRDETISVIAVGLNGWRVIFGSWREISCTVEFICVRWYERR